MNLSDFINSLSVQGAAWYSGVTGANVVVPGTSAAQAQAQATAALSTTSPTLAAILSNPLLLILGLAALVVIVLVFLKK